MQTKTLPVHAKISMPQSHIHQLLWGKTHNALQVTRQFNRKSF